MLRPLRYYTKQNLKQDLKCAKEGRYESLRPALKIILCNVALEEIPGELYQIGNVEALSVRGNKLTEIAPAIGGMSELKELNLSCNRLRYLPFELLPLLQCNLKRLASHPNQFVSPYRLHW